MPPHRFEAARFLDKETAGPEVEVRPEEPFDEIENLRVETDLIEIEASLVLLADILGRLSRLKQSEQPGQF
jgi:hypothetical protein